MKSHYASLSAFLTTAVQYAPKSWRMFPVQMHKWLSDKLWQKGDILKISPYPNPNSSFALIISLMQQVHSIVVPLRKVPFLLSMVLESGPQHLYGKEMKTESLCAKRFGIHILLGMFYSCITAHLGFAVNSGEYKVMGMAAFGKPTFHEEMKKLLLLHDDGSFSLDLSYFQYHLHPRNPTSKKFEQLWESQGILPLLLIQSKKNLYTGPISQPQPNSDLKRHCCILRSTLQKRQAQEIYVWQVVLH